MPLSRKLRLLRIHERRQVLLDSLKPSLEISQFWEHQTPYLPLADSMVETAVGCIEIPVGVVQGLLVNGIPYDLPLATEEPSVCAAATFGAAIVARGGGFTAEADEPRIRAQIFLENCTQASQVLIMNARSQFESLAEPLLDTMTQRGGGLRNLGTHWHPLTCLLELWFEVDVRDAMGANLMNTMAETLSPLAEEVSGGRKLMAILTNEGSCRLARSRFEVETRHLARAGVEGNEVARRIVLASELAWEDSRRAVTHNKGIMNGVSALALATGNDTRALEAAVHQFAIKDGLYRSLSRYHLQGNHLVGELEIPVPLALVGGATGVHPSAKLYLALTQAQTARQLGCLAASLGLAQNLAALLALVTEGIQKGHMSLHARRESFKNNSKENP